MLYAVFFITVSAISHTLCCMETVKKQKKQPTPNHLFEKASACSKNMFSGKYLLKILIRHDGWCYCA
jgi:hypothetical protein